MAYNSMRHRFLCNNSGSSILLHGVILRPDAKSYDKRYSFRIVSSVCLDGHSASEKHIMHVFIFDHEQKSNLLFNSYEVLCDPMQIHRC